MDCKVEQGTLTKFWALQLQNFKFVGNCRLEGNCWFEGNCRLEVNSIQYWNKGNLQKSVR
jgi:hypothetical protein